jgi:hypothetical protein
VYMCSAYGVVGCVAPNSVSRLTATSVLLESLYSLFDEIGVCYAGCGKTTLLSQLTVDFAQQNRSTLWASFEGTKDKLITKLVQQYYKAGTFTKLPKKEQHKVRTEFVCVEHAVVVARQWGDCSGCTHC